MSEFNERSEFDKFIDMFGLTFASDEQMESKSKSTYGLQIMITDPSSMCNEPDKNNTVTIFIPMHHLTNKEVDQRYEIIRKEIMIPFNEFPKKDERVILKKVSALVAMIMTERQQYVANNTQDAEPDNQVSEYEYLARCSSYPYIPHCITIFKCPHDRCETGNQQSVINVRDLSTNKKSLIFVAGISEGDCGQFVKKSDESKENESNAKYIYEKYQVQTYDHVITRAQRVLDIMVDVFSTGRNILFPNNFVGSFVLEGFAIDGLMDSVDVGDGLTMLDVIHKKIIREIFDHKFNLCGYDISNHDIGFDDFKKIFAAYVLAETRKHVFVALGNYSADKIYVVTFMFNEMMAKDFSVQFQDICELYKLERF